MANDLAPTILLVEDDDVFRNLLAKSLVRWGFDVIEAANALQAFVFLKQTTRKIDLVLSDLILPQMSGLELLNEIRKTSLIPVVLITGNDEALQTESFLEIKNVSCLRKPFKQEVLRTAIKEALASSYLPETQSVATSTN